MKFDNKSLLSQSNCLPGQMTHQEDKNETHKNDCHVVLLFSPGFIDSEWGRGSRWQRGSRDERWCRRDGCHKRGMWICIPECVHFQLISIVFGFHHAGIFTVDLQQNFGWWYNPGRNFFLVLCHNLFMHVCCSCTSGGEVALSSCLKMEKNRTDWCMIEIYRLLSNSAPKLAWGKQILVYLPSIQSRQIWR